MSKLYPDYKRNPRLADLGSDAVDVLCALLSEHPAHAASGLDLADFVDTFVRLQDMGYAKLCTDGDRYWIELSPEGRTLQ